MIKEQGLHVVTVEDQRHLSALRISMSINEAMPSPSTVFKPDLDWSQVRETLRMLNLAVAHITAALSEGDESVAALGDAFTSMAGDAEIVHLTANELPTSNIKAVIMEKCGSISA